MAKTFTRMMAVVAVVLLVVLGDTTTSSDAAALSPRQCKLERRLAVNACKAILYGNPPSAYCCERVRVTHIQCVCSVITPQLAALIGNVNHAIRIIQRCGRPVPRHFKCGSITTP